MKQLVVVLAVLCVCVCEGLRLGQLCSGNVGNSRRGSDSWGQGHYGAPRGSRLHKGVDIVCSDGATVLSPLDGTLNGSVVVYSDRKKDAINSGVVLRSQGHCFKLFYVRPDRSWGAVRRGQRIGVMLPMQSVYPRITSHLHLQRCDKEDPTPYL